MRRLSWVLLLLFLAGCAVTPPALPTASPAPSQAEIEPALARAFLPPDDGGVCRWDVLGRSEEEIYVWATCRGTSPPHSAMSAPAVIYLDGVGHIRDVKLPSDGDAYAASIRKLFPPAIQKLVFNYPQLAPSPTAGEQSERRLQNTKAPSTPVPRPAPAPAAQVNAADVLGFTPIAQPGDGILYARADGSVILHDLITGDEQTLLGAESYVLDPAAGEGYFLLPISYPVTASPDGQWLIIPTQWQGTWLVAADGGQPRKIADHPLAVTWAPDNLHFAYIDNRGPHPAAPNTIFEMTTLRDSVAKALAELPGKVFYPVWSPGCPEAPSAPGRDCGRHLAASAYTDNPTPTLTIWLIDAATGKRRELCRYAPPGREIAPSDYLWSMTGDALWAMPGERVCPLDGGPARPLSRERLSRWDALSPNRMLMAAVESNDHAAITVRRTDSGAGVVYSGKWSNIHVPVTWLGDSENLVVVMGQEQGHDIFILQLFDGKLTPIAQNATFLGVMSQLRQRNAFRADGSENAVMLPPAGPETTWQPYHLPETKMTLRVPAGWRVQQVDRDRYVIANFTMTRQAGLFPLPPDALEIVISRTYGRGRDIEPGVWLRQSQETLAFGHDVEKTTLAGRPALHVMASLEPLRESWRTVQNNYEIIIERAPLNPAFDAVFHQILDSIQWVAKTPES